MVGGPPRSDPVRDAERVARPRDDGDDEENNRLKVDTEIIVELGEIVDKQLKTNCTCRTVVMPDRTIARPRDMY